MSNNNRAFWRLNDALAEKASSDVLFAFDISSDGKKQYRLFSDYNIAHAFCIQNAVFTYEWLDPSEPLKFYYDADRLYKSVAIDDPAEIRNRLWMYIARTYEELSDRPYEQLPEEAIQIETCHRSMGNFDKSMAFCRTCAQ